MKIKYVGLKDQETAFSDLTGIVWTQGLEADVKPEHAQRMLNHPDVFAVSQALDEAPEVAASVATAEVHLEALAAMDAKQLHALAKERGLHIHHLAGADKVRAALTAKVE